MRIKYYDCLLYYELKDGKPVPPPKQTKLTDLKPLSDEEAGELPF